MFFSYKDAAQYQSILLNAMARILFVAPTHDSNQQLVDVEFLFIYLNTNLISSILILLYQITSDYV